MKYDYIFDSGVQTYEKEFRMDYENDTPLSVLFVKEDIILHADAHGNAVFLNMNGEEIFRDKAVGKNRFFGKIYCSVTNNAITVQFPVTKLIDHYPHCDGEYDRWSEVIVEKIPITCAVGK